MTTTTKPWSAMTTREREAWIAENVCPFLKVGEMHWDDLRGDTRIDPPTLLNPDGRGIVPMLDGMRKQGYKINELWERDDTSFACLIFNPKREHVAEAFGESVPAAIGAACFAALTSE